MQSRNCSSPNAVKKLQLTNWLQSSPWSKVALLKQKQNCYYWRWKNIDQKYLHIFIFMSADSNDHWIFYASFLLLVDSKVCHMIKSLLQMSISMHFQIALHSSGLGSHAHIGHLDLINYLSIPSMAIHLPTDIEINGQIGPECKSCAVNLQRIYTIQNISCHFMSNHISK